MYEKGKSVEDAKLLIGEEVYEANLRYVPEDSQDPKKVGLGKYSPFLLKIHSYSLTGSLLKNLRLLDNEFDELFMEIISLGERSYHSKRKVDKVLKKVLELKDSLRNIEHDVEEYVNAFSMVDHLANSNSTLFVLQSLSQVNDTYLTVYNVTLSKYKWISNSRVMVSNIIISIVAVTVAIFGILR